MKDTFEIFYGKCEYVKYACPYSISGSEEYNVYFRHIFKDGDGLYLIKRQNSVTGYLVKGETLLSRDNPLQSDETRELFIFNNIDTGKLDVVTSNRFGSTQISFVLPNGYKLSVVV